MLSSLHNILETPHLSRPLCRVTGRIFRHSINCRNPGTHAPAGEAYPYVTELSSGLHHATMVNRHTAVQSYGAVRQMTPWWQGQLVQDTSPLHVPYASCFSETELARLSILGRAGGCQERDSHRLLLKQCSTSCILRKHDMKIGLIGQERGRTDLSTPRLLVHFV